LVVQIDDTDGTRREETLTYKAAPGQSTVEAAATALRALPASARLWSAASGEWPCAPTNRPWRSPGVD